jgi:hypothetical protein
MLFHLGFGADGMADGQEETVSQFFPGGDAARQGPPRGPASGRGPPEAELIESNPSAISACPSSEDEIEAAIRPEGHNQARCPSAWRKRRVAMSADGRLTIG